MSDEKPAPENQNENTNTQAGMTASELTGVPVKRSWLKLFFIGMGSAIVGLTGLVAVTLFLEGKEGFLGHEQAPAAPVKPPPTATEILTEEMAGKIETAPVNAEALTQPPEVELPTTAELESRDFDEAVKDFDDEDGAKDKKGKNKKDKKSERKLASVDKSPLKLTFDKGASKVSKNLDKKKVLSLLEKKLDCHPKLPHDTKSVKAEIKLSKSGDISNIKVTPGSAEKELAKCMRKKLGDSKVLKPKNKSVAQITVQFKLK